MISIENTKRYDISPKPVILEAFETAYNRNAETQPAAPPDKATMVCSVVSMVFIAVMFYLTAMQHSDQKTLWYALMAAMVGIIAIIIYKYLGKRKEYLNAMGKPSTIACKRDAFLALFEKNGALPEEMSTAKMLSLVSPLMGKQNDETVNAALRIISEHIARLNNPSDPLCKLITPFGDKFNQQRQRFYFTKKDDKYVFYDSDWMNPNGEIVCEESDIMSYGVYGKYSGVHALTKVGKIRPDAGIIDIKDDRNHIYFEVHSDYFERMKKLMQTKKEMK